MRCCMGGLNLIRELEGELKRLGHVEPTLVGVVKGRIRVAVVEHVALPWTIDITGPRVPDHFPSARRHRVTSETLYAHLGIGQPSEHTHKRSTFEPYRRPSG